MTEGDAIAWCNEHKVTIRFDREVRIEAQAKGLLLGKGATLLDAFQDLQTRYEPARMAFIDIAQHAYYGWFMADPRDAPDQEYGDNERWASVVKAIVRHLKSHEIPTCFLSED